MNAAEHAYPTDHHGVVEIDAAAAGDRRGDLFLVGRLDELVDQLRGQRVFHPAARPAIAAAVPSAISRCDFPVPESPIRQSGMPS